MNKRELVVVQYAPVGESELESETDVDAGRSSEVLQCCTPLGCHSATLLDC